ncbi:MAG: AAA family ATPase [Ginsengibacter sp.]
MQKIDNIEIKNFKSIRHQKIEGCKRVNVFIGYPNVGKSNILEALSLLTFIREKRRPIGLKGLVRFEKLSQLFNYNNIQNPAVVYFNKDYSLLVKYEDEKHLEFLIRDKNKKKPYNFPISVGEETLNSGKTDGVDDFSGWFPDIHKLIVKPYKFSESKVFNESFSALELKIPFGKNLFELIVNNSEIQKEFSELLKSYDLDLVIDVSTNDVKISPAIKGGVIHTIPISLMADTLIRLIFFKAAIITNKNSVLLFEEPEAHMFPPYISKFTGDIIHDENDNQYFIATHSPFVLNDFMENLKSDELAIYIVSYKKETGETIIHRMNDEDMHEAYQFGYDFFMNIDKFISQEQHDEV